MKIAYISPGPIPSQSANSIHIIHMCQALANNVDKLTLYTYSSVNNYEINKKISNIYGITLEFKIVKSLNIQKETFITRIFHGLISSLKCAFAKHDYIISRSNWGTFFSVLLGLKVLHEEHSPPVHIHNMFFKFYGFKRLNKFIVISENLKNYIKNKYEKTSHHSKILLLRDAAPNRLINLKHNRKLKKNINVFKVGFSGHLYKGKGIDLILKIAKNMEDVEFHILGGPNTDIPKFKKISTSNCKFYGNVDFAKVHKILMQFDILLAPYSKVVSIGKGKMDIGKWMSPLKIFEYMAIGKPFITSKIEVLQEFLVDDLDTVLAKPDDVNDWIKKIRYMQQNPDIMLRMSKAIRLKFVKNFTWDQRAKKLLSEI